MHIADGILPVGACVAAHGIALAGISWLGRRIAAEEVVRLGLISSAVFVASTVHFPLGGTSVHLGLYGLAGIILGHRCFPVIFTTLLFQSLLLQHGGLLVLGVNAINIGCGALCAAMVWRSPLPDSVRAFLAGFVGTAIPAALMATEFQIAGYGRGFGVVAMVYLAVAAIEGAVTTFIVSFLRRVRPAVLARAAA
jgi:cobalt/nickel transport system permease protein